MASTLQLAPPAACLLYLLFGIEVGVRGGHYRHYRQHKAAASEDAEGCGRICIALLGTVLCICEGVLALLERSCACGALWHLFADALDPRGSSHKVSVHADFVACAWFVPALACLPHSWCGIPGHACSEVHLNLWSRMLLDIGNSELTGPHAHDVVPVTGPHT